MPTTDRIATFLALALLLPACTEDPDGFDGQAFGMEAEDDASPADSEGEADSEGADPAPEAVCEPTDAKLVADDGHNVGTVTITTVDEGVLVDVSTVGRWRLQSVHAFVGVDAPPSDGAELLPQQFPHAAEVDAGQSFRIAVPFDAMGGGRCGDTIGVAVFAEVIEQRNGEVLDERVAWAEATDATWGTAFDAALCCE